MRLVTLAATLCAVFAATACATSLLAAGPKEEVRKLAKSYWEARLTQCGDTHYSIQVKRACAACDTREVLVQFQGAAVSSFVEQASEAERLNDGIEMKGFSTVDARLFRAYFEGKWERWRKPTGFGDKTPRVSVVRKGGGWKFVEPGPRSLDQGWKPVECDKLPKDTAQP